jgi:hypothetical protein
VLTKPLESVARYTVRSLAIPVYSISTRENEPIKWELCCKHAHAVYCMLGLTTHSAP